MSPRRMRMEDGECFTITNFIVLLCPNIVRVIKSRRLRWAGHVAIMEEGRIDFKSLTGPPTRKRSLGRPLSRWEDNFRMYLKEIGINTRNSIDSTRDRYYWRALVNAALSLRIP